MSFVTFTSISILFFIVFIKSTIPGIVTHAKAIPKIIKPVIIIIKDLFINILYYCKKILTGGSIITPKKFINKPPAIIILGFILFVK